MSRRFIFVIAYIVWFPVTAAVLIIPIILSPFYYVVTGNDVDDFIDEILTNDTLLNIAFLPYKIIED
jgi:hypothetical protein